MNNLRTFFIIYLLSLVPVIVYALRHSGRRFSLRRFVIENRDRLILGLVAAVVFAFVLLSVAADDLSALLKPFGITFDATASKTAIGGAVGLFIGGSLVIAMNAKKAKN